MKKLLSLAVALLCTLPMLAGPGTDTFTYNDTGASIGGTASGSWTGPNTGAKYDFTTLGNMFTTYFYASQNSLFTVATAPEGCKIQSISRSGGNDDLLNVYVSDTPITADNISSLTPAGTLANEATFVVEGNHPFFALTAVSGTPGAYELNFTWAEDGGGDVVTPSTDDHITAANLKAQNPDGNFSATGYQDFDNVNASMTYTGESGAIYDFTQLLSNGEWWVLGWKDNDKGTMTNSKDGGYITSVEFAMAGSWLPSQVDFYVSDSPFTDPLHPYNNANAKPVTLYKDGDKYPVWETDGHYQYFCLSTVQELINDLHITWSAEAPVLPCKAPSISKPWGRITPGTEVTVSNQTTGATMHINVYLNDELDAELSKETTENYTFALPGKANDKVTVKAYATKEGYTDSGLTTETFDIVLPQAGYVSINPSYNLVPGMELTLTTETEGATIHYTYTIYKGRDDNWEPVNPVIESGEKTGTSPVTVTIPEENVEAGMVFAMEAWAECEGYDNSDVNSIAIDLDSNILPVPTFDPESGAELQSGKTVTMRKQGNAKEMHYTVNGGEEQVTEEWSVTFTVTEPLTIVAWQTGEAPYKDSEKVTATYTIEVLGENVDAIYPSLFTDKTSVSTYTVYEPYKSAKTNISYKYDGGMYPSNDVDCFYFDANTDEGLYSVLYNVDNEKKRVIKRIKLESPYSWSKAYVLLTQDAPVTEVTLNAEVNNYDYKGTRLRVNTDDSKFKFGEWIDLTSLDPYDYDEAFQTAKYFTIWRFGQQCYISRVLVEYADDPSGIEAIDAENQTEAIYDLNGVKVSNLRKATPGVYIRIVDGKARKVMVK